ncbi:hypothetical protein OS493_028156 [Desmophyllum pertusum]|uniref:Uncharacterized protein n=1 Tax=Desmophyllum pertusum TaxID=174260 RepID=A0A9W9Z9D8_9CNID|nr:hypothetical protein OS493_028156 [Desmophyllum pertusum]
MKWREKQFTLTVCKDQAETVDPVETDASSFDETATKSTDIHLHCKEWDRVLEEGNWEPEQDCGQTSYVLDSF